jgi:glycosyltransferase involved in cell wall biosynthesis
MQRSTPSIWLLLDSRQPGGIESHVTQLARGLRDHGWRTRVVFLQNHGPHPMKEQLSEAGIPWSTLDGSWRELSRQLRTDRPSVLHTHGYKAGLVGRVAALLAGVPVASTFHAGETGTGRVRLYDTLDRWSAILSQRRFAVSQAISRRLPWPSTVINNFVDMPAHVSTGQQIAFVGRLSHEKGPDLYAELAGFFAAEQFHVYGGGVMAAELDRSAPANVVFHGPQERMDQVWPRIGLLVMTSRQEGLPMAALEAMARGIPVVASATGNLPRLIDHHRNGALCPVADMQAFAAAVSEWLADRDVRLRWSTNARCTIERNYSTVAILPGLLDQYRRLAGD